MQTALLEDIDLMDRVKAKMRERLEDIDSARQVRRHDLGRFTDDCLQILPKKGPPMQLRLNGVQRKLDALLDNQKAETGKVRAIIVKARQLGISTYVAARFYHRVEYEEGIRSLVMTHRDDATQNLYGMMRRYHKHNEDAQTAIYNNAGRLQLENQSSITVGTAGKQVTGVGRSFTFQLAHLSELALWDKAAEHLTGLMESISKLEGSEIIVESTAQGMGDSFHSMAMEALRGESEYQLIFLAWFEHEEYQAEPPEGWVPGTALEELIERFPKLTRQQLYWAERENRNMCMAAGIPADEICWRFRQEYPSTLDEAFRASRRGGYIAASVCAKARQRVNPHQAEMPLVLGCDFATGGGARIGEMLDPDQMKEGEGSEDGDSNVFISRRGRVLGKELYDRFKERDTMVVANRLAGIMDRLQPARVFMDKGGGGASVFDILVARGYRQMELVDFGMAAKPIDERKYRNRRAELAGRFRDWLQDGDIPDEDLLESEITATWVKRDDEGGLLLAPKREVRAKYGMSPDGFDAAKLTCAATVMAPAADVGQWAEMTRSSVAGM